MRMILRTGPDQTGPGPGHGRPRHVSGWLSRSVCFLLAAPSWRLLQLHKAEAGERPQEVGIGQRGDQHREQVGEAGRCGQHRAAEGQGGHGEDGGGELGKQRGKMEGGGGGLLGTFTAFGKHP